MTRRWSMTLLLVLPLLCAAAGCRGGGGGGGGTIGTEPEAPPSEIVKRFRAAGGPPLDRAWSLEEHGKALAIVEAMAGDDWTLAPRQGDPGSRPLFDRLVAGDPLAAGGGPEPGAQRRGRLLAYHEALVAVAMLYLGRGTELSDAEAVALTGAQLRAAAALAAVRDPEEDDPAELADPVHEALGMLIDEDFADDQRAPLIGHLQATAPALLRGLPADLGADLLAALEQAASYPALARHAAAMNALLTAARSAAPPA
jgi:hypothetical protein